MGVTLTASGLALRISAASAVAAWVVKAVVATTVYVGVLARWGYPTPKWLTTSAHAYAEDSLPNQL